MKIYFACSITGGRQDEVSYERIVKALIAEGHQVPTASLAGMDAVEKEAVLPPVRVFERDTRWIRECDALVAEVSTPSHGVGFEIGYALNFKKPVICIYRSGVLVSKMILGNRDPLLRTCAYLKIEDALDFIFQELAET